MDSKDFYAELEKRQGDGQSQAKEQEEHRKKEQHLKTVVASVADAASKISKTIKDKSDHVTVDNFPASVKTPDVEKLVLEIKRLREELSAKETSDDESHKLLTNLLDAVSRLPKEIPQPKDPLSKIEVTNFPDQTDYTEAIQEVVEAVKAIEVVVEPKISVKPADVKLEQDFSELFDKFDMLEAAIKAISIVIPETDDQALIDAVEKVSDTVNSLTFPSPNYVFPFKSATGAAVQVQLDEDGKLPTTATFTGSVNAVTEYEDGSTTVATPSAPGITFDNAGTISFVSDTNPLPVDATVNATVDLGDQNIGNATANTQRVVLASDQPTVDVDVTSFSANVIDANNSSTTPLGANATFTGTATDVSDYAAITVSGYSDRDSATDGIQLQFSSDGTNWDETLFYNYVSGGVGQDIIVPTIARYFRVRVVNGTNAQTIFRLQTILHAVAPPGTPVRMKDVVSGERDAQLVKASIMAQASGSGNFVPVASNAQGKLQVAAEIDDGGGSITVDGAVDSNLQVGNVDVSESNPVPTEVINSRGVVDTNNSSSTPLSANGTFTGTATETLDYSQIWVFVYSNVASATNGLNIEWSTDGTNWDEDDVFTIPANNAKIFSFGPPARYMRVRYVNGSSAQASFRLQVTLKPTATKASSHKLEEAPISQDDAELVKAQLVAQLPNDGAFTNIDATAGGNLKVSLEEIDGTILGGGTEANALRVTIANNSTGVLSVDDNGGSLTVDGTVAATQSGAWNLNNITGTVSLPTGAATAANQSTIIGHVDGIETALAGTLTVGGTVTANLSATDNAVLDDIAANQTDNSQKTQIVDAAGNAVSVTGNKLDVNATASLAGTTLPISGASEAVGVAIVDGSGNQITSFGGGTQYTDGDADATPTGTVALGFDGANVQALATDASGNLQVDVLSGTQTDALTDTELRASPVVVDLGANNDVTVTSSALPTGAATAANQSTIIGHVDGIESLLTTVETNTDYGTVVGGGTETGALRVTLANNSTGVLSIDDNGGSITIDATSLPLPTGAATAANQQTDALTDTELRASPVVVDLGANNDVTVTGTVTVDGSGVTQPVSGTITANLSATDNAVLDTIAANTARGATSNITSVAGSATSVQLLAAASTRIEATITNDSTADLYIKMGTTASTSSYTVKLGQDESYIVDKYTGRIDGIWASATGNARITEITP